MRYISTGQVSLPTSLKEAVLSGIPDDGGLYLPETIPQLDKHFIQSLESLSLQEIALGISAAFLADDIPVTQLQEIVTRSMNFDVKLKKLDDQLSVLETFHGPTMAFKDFGARFMAQLMSFLIRGEDRELTILVATSGDTGSAVASGFLGIPGIRVIILYPEGKVSPSQEKQLTTQGQNITALEVAGNFDDCQRQVKRAFADSELRQVHRLSSANSINFARLLPQSFYYAYIAGKLMSKKGDLVVSVPSGNFGNLTAGLMAKRMGIPLDHFIASTNRNDVFPKFLQSGEFFPRPSDQTLSNAMDVGDPSNLARIRYLFKDDIQAIRTEISSWSFDDEQTREKIAVIFERFNYIIDPHTSVGFLGLNQYLETAKKEVEGVVISTAHPAKFPESVEPIIGESIPVPPQLAQYLEREKQATHMSIDYEDFRQFLTDTLG
ncbi:MAG: threonine synthase [Candidatus Marinimicrobia bacterium]|nr:threonine synthase [Candidatus Neomarinimicrobiota bacterium]